MRCGISLLAVTAYAVLACAAPASAQDRDFPKRSIRVIVPFAPGAGVDIAARLVGVEMANALGQPFVIENRAGAAGQIGVQAMLAAPADGYTLIAVSSGVLSVGPQLRSVPYNVLTDLLPVGIMYSSDYVIAANRNHPAQNLKALIDASSNATQDMHFGVSGIGSHHHLALELLKMMSGAKFSPVPYGSWPKAVLAVATGEIPAAIADLATVQAVPQLRLMAVTGAQRQRALPDVPTVAEAGVPGYAADGWVAIFVAAGTPQDIVDRLRSELNRVLAMPAIQERFRAAGLEPGSPMSQDNLRALVKKDYETWGRVIKAANIRSE